MVTSNGVTNESPRFIPHELQKPLRIEARQGAVVRLPSPVEETGVRPAVGDAILVSVYDDTTGAVCVDWSQWVFDPFPCEEITLLHHNI